jgi:hypothetical protein
MTHAVKRIAVAPLLVVAILGTVLVLWAFPRGVQDWQFQLAGAADPFLGRPAPGTTILLGLVVSGIAAVALKLVRGAPRRTIRLVLLGPLIAGWVAYGAGAATTLAGGGQASYAGTLGYDLGAPLQAAATVPATCRTPVGKQMIVAKVRPTDVTGTSSIGGLPYLWVHGDVTGELHPFDYMAIPTESEAHDGSVLAPFVFPGLPDRPLPYLESPQGDGTIATYGPIGFLAAYDYVVTELHDGGLSGVATLTATRWDDPYGGVLRWVNLRIPDDPWPESFQLTITWSCDPSRPS